MKENKASQTAYTVLQGLMYVAQKTRHQSLVTQEMREYGKAILSATQEGQKRLRQIDQPGFGWSVRIREALLVPGLTLHYILRKKAIEYRTRHLIADGVEQIICLGAGFDSLALRLANEFRHVNIIEIDHPETQRDKVKALQKSQLDNFHYLDIDFTHQNLQDRLGQFPHFHKDKRSLYICEGVMMYLSDTDITHMFEALRSLSGVGTDFLFTALEPENSPQNNSRKLLYLILKLMGEPIKWDIPQTDIADFLKTQNCTLCHLDNSDSFKKLFLTADDQSVLHRGEYLVQASFQ